MTFEISEQLNHNLAVVVSLKVTEAVLDAAAKSNGDGIAAGDLVQALDGRFPASEVAESIAELLNVRALGEAGAKADEVPVDLPPDDFPLSTLVLNVTSKCNLACT